MNNVLLEKIANKQKVIRTYGKNMDLSPFGYVRTGTGINSFREEWQQWRLQNTPKYKVCRN